VTQIKRRRPLHIPVAPSVHIRRSYAESRFGQLHLLTAYPSGGGFDERTPVLCLHQAGASGRVFTPLLPEFGKDRSVYAPDLSGHGSSDNAGPKPSVADYANSIADFLDSVRLRSVDVVGYQLGSLVAAELAASRPQQVRRLALISVPVYNAQDRLAFAPPGLTNDDGTHIADEWKSLVANRGPGLSVKALAEMFADRLRTAESLAAAMAASFEYPANQRFPLVKQPVLVVRPKDELWEQTARVRLLLSRHSTLDMPEYGAGVFNAAPEKIATTVREFFDR
jgi:pimeloyl-ACP methyl ester carboxylesterase